MVCALPDPQQSIGVRFCKLFLRDPLAVVPDDQFDPGGHRVDFPANGSFSDINANNYIEYGLTDRLTLINSLYFKYIEKEDDTTRTTTYGVADIDLAGYAAGSSRRVGSVSLEPAPWSLFRYGDNDRGSLNSEFYLRVAAARRLTIRGGASHYVTGYRVSSGSKARYLRFDTVPFVALRWRP